MPDLRHRALFHHAMGCYLVERVFGHTLINSSGRQVSTRDVAEEHIIEDMGFLPSVEDWIDALPIEKWHGGIHRLPKDQRPLTPGEDREATRSRVLAALHGVLKYQVSDLVVDDVIAAVRGAEKEKD